MLSDNMIKVHDRRTHLEFKCNNLDNFVKKKYGKNAYISHIYTQPGNNDGRKFATVVKDIYGTNATDEITTLFVWGHTDKDY